MLNRFLRSSPRLSLIKSLVSVAVSTLTLYLAPTAMADQPMGMLELAPLRSSMGEPSVRAELLVRPQLAAAWSFEQASSASEVEGKTDESTSFAAEALWYPLGVASYPVFVGAGLRYEQATHHQERPSDAVSGVSRTSSNSEDRWVRDQRYISLTQTLGYRLFMMQSEWTAFTASLRYVRDDLLHKASTVRDEEIHSHRRELDETGRARHASQFMLHAGISFQ